ncbi:diaminobutyrate--2-oxoglutarate aminotransferase [Xenorhabdus mauleonii]|uniref:Diaminobutyrate--2-oxoglutarate transaminase n=1 Tax=Xenorhabdus mauleonii TaxID=351675 RepID=A0A1I3T433_9GAMM|nr:diaminobutyrate--2-oxoglutarate transaminase [Xenorhabdus mauleonii]PHM44686.1 diaminobutyrate--2-oxoglutarate aminotransferase [Xenorhabdus mauleonii]SFJ64247.1 diaminobutyrate aminotransferase apoenzyme [Xenorhabdus mauleonii]
MEGLIIQQDDYQAFELNESEVRSYCRKFQKVFYKASGSYLYDQNGSPYLDFLSCAGALNYGHNHPALKTAVLEYVSEDGIQGALDLYTKAKKDFITAFKENILVPRGLTYKLQFTSPTGTSVVESAIKLARKVTQRRRVVAFTNGFHGMTGTALGLTGNKDNRQPVLDTDVERLPFDLYFSGLDSLELFRKLLEDRSSGYELPAAVIVETVQGEGGINVASKEWVRKLRALTLEKGILLIIDDVQAGCGRTGSFFSFEYADIKPDMVCLSKSLSGYGYPLSLLLMESNLDIWSPGEDNGTFRGNTLAMVTATAAICNFWSDNSLSEKIENDEVYIAARLGQIKSDFPHLIKEVKGRGLMYGLEFFDPRIACKVAQRSFENKLIVERCGNEDQVLKLLPPLTIEREDLDAGIQTIRNVIEEISKKMKIENAQNLKNIT